MNRVCFVIPSLGAGGTERQLTYLIRGLVPDHEVTVICTRQAGALAGEVRRLGAYVRVLAGWGGWDFRLHKRVMIPLLESNPEVPVHAVVTRYERRPRRRTRVTVRVSPPLPVDARSMAPDEVTGIVRDALLQLGGLEYVDRYARDVKAELRATRESPGR